MLVVDKISTVLSADAAPITVTSFFGVHVWVAEGDALGDLASPVDRQRLMFTLATFIDLVVRAACPPGEHGLRGGKRDRVAGPWRGEHS